MGSVPQKHEVKETGTLTYLNAMKNPKFLRCSTKSGFEQVLKTFRKTILILLYLKLIRISFQNRTKHVPADCHHW